VTTNWILTVTACLTCAALPATLHADQQTGLPSALYEEWRLSPSPRPGAIALVNPPSLQWASAKHWEGRDVLYRIELSDDAQFPPDRTICGKIQRFCFFNPHAKLKSGTWYWRYEIHEGKNCTTKGPYSFVIKADTPVFESPAFETFLAGISTGHPRVVTLGRGLAEIRRTAATHPLAHEIIRQGQKAAGSPMYDGPPSDKDPARSRALERKASHEIRSVNDLVDAYVLSGNAAMRYRTLGSRSKKTEAFRFFSPNRATRM